MQAMRPQPQQVGPQVDLGPVPSPDVGPDLRAAARLGDALLAVTEPQQVVARDVEVVAAAEPAAPFAMPAFEAMRTEALVKSGFDEAKTRFDQAKTREDYEDAARHLSHALKRGASDALRGELFALLDSMIADSARSDFHPWLRQKKARLLLIPGSSESSAVSAELKKARSVATLERLEPLQAAFPDASKAMQANIIEALKLLFVGETPEKQKRVDRLLDQLLLMKVYPETSFVDWCHQAGENIRENKQGVGSRLKKAFKATLKEKDLDKMDAMQGALFASLDRKLASSFVTAERRACLEKVINGLKNRSPYVLSGLESVDSENDAAFREAVRLCGQRYHVWGEERVPVDKSAAKQILRALSYKGFLEADAKLAHLYCKANNITRAMRHLYKCYGHMPEKLQSLRLDKLKEACGEENSALYDFYENVLKNALTAKDIMDADELQQYINVMGPALGWSTLVEQLVEMSKTPDGRALLKQCDYSQMPVENLRYGLACKVAGESVGVKMFFWNAVRNHPDAGASAKSVAIGANTIALPFACAHVGLHKIMG